MPGLLDTVHGHQPERPLLLRGLPSRRAPTQPHLSHTPVTDQEVTTIRTPTTATTLTTARVRDFDEQPCGISMSGVSGAPTGPRPSSLLALPCVRIWGQSSRFL